MRIAHVTDVYLPRLGGIESQVHDLAAQQVTAGHDVTVFTGTPAGSDGPAEDGPDDVAVVRLRPGDEPVGGAAARRPGRSLTAALDPDRYDVVHCHSSLVSPLAWQAARLAGAAGVPTVVTMHSMVPTPLAARPLGRAVAEWVGPDVVWTAVSRVAADRLAPFVPRPVAVLPNGVDEGAWRRATGREPRPDDDLTVVAVLRLCARKRVLPLLDVLETVRDRLPADVGLRAVLAGAGPQEPAVRRTLARRGMSWVELPGRLSRPQVRRLLAVGDVFVAPARMESFGIAALEARCAGLPVVAARGSGVEDFIRDGVEGRLVGSDDHMAAVITRLLLRPEERHAIARHNASVPSGLSWSRTAPLVEEVYRRAGAVGSPAAERAAPPLGAHGQ